jgi:hypothetical protein
MNDLMVTNIRSERENGKFGLLVSTSNKGDYSVWVDAESLDHAQLEGMFHAILREYRIRVGDISRSDILRSVNG